MMTIFNKYNIDLNIEREIVKYGREVNQNFLIFWFVDAIADYILYIETMERQ